MLELFSDIYFFCITSFPYTIRWWVVMRDLKTTTQLLLVVLSNKLSASCGMFTFISFVHWIKSAIQKLLWVLWRKINNIQKNNSVHIFYIVIFSMKTEELSSKINNFLKSTVTLVYHNFVTQTPLCSLPRFLVLNCFCSCFRRSWNRSTIMTYTISD